jgi:hypothetical protein
VADYLFFRGFADWAALKLSRFKIFKLLSIEVEDHMILIRNVVQQALSTGYLTVEAEDQLRQMLARKYDREDLKAFMSLQQAAMAGLVKQESREVVEYAEC